MTKGKTYQLTVDVTLAGKTQPSFLWKELANNFDMTIYLNECKFCFKKEVIPMGQEIKQQFFSPIIKQEIIYV